MALNLIKLCVGATTIDDMMDWRQRSRDLRVAQGLSPHMFHTTRMWPRREKELLDGGSIYWVLKGQIMVRQELAGFEEEIGEDGIRRCNILMEPEFILTEIQPRRAFQGWRYLEAKDAPKDLPAGGSHVPTELASDLADLGLL
jgi:hypothetical protein